MSQQRARIDVTWAFEEELEPRAKAIVKDLLDDVLEWGCAHWEEVHRRTRHLTDIPQVAMAHTIAKSRRHRVHLFMYIGFIDLEPDHLTVMVSSSRSRAMEYMQTYLDEVHTTLGSPAEETKH